MLQLYSIWNDNDSRVSAALSFNANLPCSELVPVYAEPVEVPELLYTDKIMCEELP